MATKGLYLQRGIKKERKSHRKLILLLAILIAFGVLISPLLWKKSRLKHSVEKSSVTAPISSEQEARRSQQNVVTGKIPKTTLVTASQDVNAPKESLPTGGALTDDKSKLEPQPSKTSTVSSDLVASSEVASQKAVTVPSEPSSTPPASHGVEKQQNIYELRSELQRKEAAEDKKAKEMVAQSALKEMPLSGSGGETASAGSTGKHTIVSLLAPEGKKQQEKPSPDKTTSKPTPMTPKDKTSATPKPQQEASVTSKPLKPATEAEKTGSSTSDREASYWIQVGAYREEANAKKVKGLIDALGYEAILKQSSHPKLGTIYIVRVPIKGSKADAQKAISVISQKTGDKPFLMEAR